MRRQGLYAKYFKRLFDICLAIVTIIVLSPIMILLALIVRWKLGSPIIFKQERPGLNEKIFTMYKFRTMTNQKDAKGDLLPDHMRLTTFGKFLRSTSLDELPELINILKGEMSFVGPRPLLVEYLPLYNDTQRRRHEVRPGLTGLAQVNGRNAISWEEKFRLDVEYIDNITFMNDCKIVFKTIITVLKRKDINSSDYATIKPFSGNERKSG